jgi:hypothetical protein
MSKTGPLPHNIVRPSSDWRLREAARLSGTAILDPRLSFSHLLVFTGSFPSLWLRAHTEDTDFNARGECILTSRRQPIGLLLGILVLDRLLFWSLTMHSYSSNTRGCSCGSSLDANAPDLVTSSLRLGRVIGTGVASSNIQCRSHPQIFNVTELPCGSQNHLDAVPSDASRIYGHLKTLAVV